VAATAAAGEAAAETAARGASSRTGLAYLRAGGPFFSIAVELVQAFVADSEVMGDLVQDDALYLSP
jgi:hypothetical protein